MILNDGQNALVAQLFPFTGRAVAVGVLVPFHSGTSTHTAVAQDTLGKVKR